MKVHTASATCLLPEIVASLCVGDPLEKRIVFCEDKFNLTLELAIAKSHGGSFGTHVFSFNRYMHKHLENTKKILSPEGCALVIKGLLLEHKSKLGCFKNIYDPNLATTVYELIAQLKSAKVTPEDIGRAKEESTGNLKRKLGDIHVLFSAYEEYINKNGLTDGNNRLYLLPEHFYNDEEITKTHVIIAGFPSLNKTLCEIFKALSARAKKIDFVVVQGENNNVYTNETYNFLQSEFEILAEQPVETVCEREQLLGGLFNPETLGKEGKYSNKIKVYQAQNPSEEIRHIAQIIRRGVLAGASYKDYAICAENVSGYELTIRRIFADYEIPFFYDGSKNLGKHPITRLVCSYIDLVRRNFDVKDLFTFVKNPLFEPDKELTDGFENYCLGCSINRRTVKNPFKEPNDNLEKYEQLRQKVMEVCSYLKEGATFNECVLAILKMIEKTQAFENLKVLGEKLSDIERKEIASYNEQVDQKFTGVIDDAVSLLGSLKFPLAEVKNVILSGMTSCKVSIIPEYNDRVFVSDFRAARYNKVKNIFAIGLTDGVPVSKIDSALLCDRDIAKMEKSKVLVEPKIKEVNRRARETACMALATFSDNLYLSYPKNLTSGEEGKPSEIIKYVVEIFSDNSAKTQIFTAKTYEELATQIGGQREKNYKMRNYLTKRSSVFAFATEVENYKEGKIDDFSAGTAYYKVAQNSGDSTVEDGILTSANADVGNYLHAKGEEVNYLKNGLSATAIEGYFECPYKNFLQRGVKLNEREKSDMQANELGNMVHEVGQIFIDRLDWNCTLEEAIELAEKVFLEVAGGEDYARHQSSAGGKLAFDLIKKEALRFCQTLYEAGKNSSLKPKFVEVAFGSAKYPAITVKTRKGEMKITGKIDRIDSDGQNMTVIDYKTGRVDGGKVDVNLYTGKKLQLFLYAKAFNQEFKPIGAYYFPISNKFIGEDDSEDPAFVGKTIADENCVKLIDNSFEIGDIKAKYIKVNFKRKKDGNLMYPQNLLTESDFEAYMEYSQKVAGEGLAEIAEGVIVPSPYEGACEYCEYHGICGFDEQANDLTRKIESVDKQDILNALEVAKNQKDEKED